MSKEAFRVLKEINSHLEKINQMHSLSGEHQDRVDAIDKMRRLRELQLIEDLNSLEKNSSDTEDNEENIQNLTIKLNEVLANIDSPDYYEHVEKLKSLRDETKKSISDLEDKTLALIDQYELLETEIADARTFLDGSAESLMEIQQEADQDISVNDDEVKSLKLRISKLFTEIPNTFKIKFDSATKRHPNSLVFSFITKKSCSGCGMQFSSAVLYNVESNFNLETCSTCSRIIIPSDIQR